MERAAPKAALSMGMMPESDVQCTVKNKGGTFPKHGLAPVDFVEWYYESSSETAWSSRPITPPTRVPFIRMNCRSEPIESSISLV